MVTCVRVDSDLVQAGVERKFEIIGEALNQLFKLDAPMAARIPDLPQIVAFRNQLIHGYATVDARTVWNVAQSSLPALLVCVNGLFGKVTQKLAVTGSCCAIGTAPECRCSFDSCLRKFHLG